MQLVKVFAQSKETEETIMINANSKAENKLKKPFNFNKRNLLPQGLEIFTTTKCNLRCKYCSARKLLNDKHPVSLSFEQMKKGIDLFAFIHKNDKTLKTVAFTGGEPFLEFNRLKMIILYIRKTYKNFQITISTNGTLLTEKKINFLFSQNVCLNVSIDGNKKAHDEQAKFVHHPENSVFDKVIKNISHLCPSIKHMLYIPVTVMKQNAGYIHKIVKNLENLGLENIEIHFDIYARWDKKSTAKAISGMRLLKKHLFNSALSNLKNQNAVFLKSSIHNDLDSRVICLSPHGKFYPSDFLCVYSNGNAYQVGELNKDGIDLKKYLHIHETAQKTLKKILPSIDELQFLDRYFYSVFNGLNTTKSIKATQKVLSVLVKEFEPINKANEIFQKLSGYFKDEQYFRRHCEDENLDALIINMNNISYPQYLEELKKPIEKLLYSKGKNKNLILRSDTNKFNVFLSAFLYSFQLAKKSDKNLKISLETSASNLNKEQIFFLKKFGIHLGINDFDTLEKIKKRYDFSKIYALAEKINILNMSDFFKKMRTLKLTYFRIGEKNRGKKYFDNIEKNLIKSAARRNFIYSAHFLNDMRNANAKFLSAEFINNKWLYFHDKNEKFRKQMLLNLARKIKNEKSIKNYFLNLRKIIAKNSP